MFVHQYLDRVMEQHGAATAIINPAGGSVTYAEFAALTDALRDRLHHLSVKPGDRIGICLTKSIDAVVAIYGILKAGAAYVPVDPNAPAARNAYIFNDCQIAAMIVEDALSDAIESELGTLDGAQPTTITLNGASDGRPMAGALDALNASDSAPVSQTVVSDPDDLAYILYTSGSTGRPKGVTLTHRNAVSFIDWCSQTFEPTHEDRFSSHAPLHFDLSILDIHVSLKHGATLVLIPHDVGRDPRRLAPLIAEQQLTIWYSAPSILALLAQMGGLDQCDWSTLRMILFAGEVFPVKHLQLLHSLMPHPAYYNLYGPTETNVCTFYRIPDQIPDDRSEPFPIGQTCSNLESLVLDDTAPAANGQEGELCIRGPAVTQGYWNLPAQTAGAYYVDDEGCPWYRTGDVVVEDADGNYLFRGRRDRMVKRHGYRIELGEIEACLYRHPEIEESAVVAMTIDEQITIAAFVAVRGGGKLSLIAMKKFCGQHLPVYMIPDRFMFRDQLPKTSTDKIDYQSLANAVADER